MKDCQGGWRPLTAPRDRPGAYSLAYANGELIYDAGSSPEQGPLVYRIEAQPIAGGEPRILGPGNAANRWVVGDQVYYAAGDILRRIPLQGGPSTILVGHDATKVAPVSYAQLLGPDTFYWSEDYYTSMNEQGFRLWAAPREGGESTLVAEVPQRGLLSQTALAADAVIATDVFGNGTAVPLDGSAPRTLANVDYRILSGIDAKGVYGYQRLWDGDVERHEMTLAPIDGGAVRPFWPAIPPRTIPMNIWPDGDRGWLVSALETLDDGLSHASVFFVDGAGQGTRVACEPTGAETILQGRPAFASDAAYVVSRHVTDNTRVTWSIVRVPRRQ